MKRSARLRFAYQLASHLKIKEVERDIIRGMTAKQFLRWEAYYSVEPFGEWRADVRAAQIVAMFHNMNVEAKHRKPIQDFLLSWDKLLKEEEAAQAQAQGQTWQEKLSIAKMWVRAVSAALPEPEEKKEVELKPEIPVTPEILAEARRRAAEMFQQPTEGTH